VKSFSPDDGEKKKHVGSRKERIALHTFPLGRKRKGEKGNAVHTFKGKKEGEEAPGLEGAKVS